MKKKPGTLSEGLKEALGMAESGASPPPPPWLINMQRHGPPPSYPHLKIPGLNAPAPPVDEYEEPVVDKSKHWGDLEEEDEEQVEDEMPDDAQVEDDVIQFETSDDDDDVIDLRKKQRKELPEDERQPLYQVLEEKEEKIAPGTLLGTSHTYVINKTGGANKRVDLLKKARRVDITLGPEELDAMENVLEAKYEEAREEEKSRTQPEDFSGMVAENDKKRKRKMENKSNKKDFKF